MKRLFLACICFLALAACGSTSPNQGSANTPVPTTAKTVPPTQHFKVGQTVKVGDTWQVTIDSAKTSPHGQFSRPQKSGNVFLIFQITVKNISNQEKNISSIAQFDLTDTTGQKYAASYDDDAGAMLDGKVEPGSPLKGSLVFEVPASVHDFRLAFEAELFAGGQTIWDITV